MDATLTRATLRNADLTCARVERADLRFCVLAGANLSSANLLDSQLEPSIFTGAIYNAKTQFPQGFDRSNKGLVRAAPVSQSPSLASIVDAPPSSLTDTSPLRSVGRRRPQPPTYAATPQPSADTQSNPNDPDGQSQTSRSTPPKRKVLFRGRWVEM